MVTEPPQTKYIQLTVDSNLKLPAVCEERKDEGYTLVVHKDNIIITGATDAAVYYGIQVSTLTDTFLEFLTFYK